MFGNRLSAIIVNAGLAKVEKHIHLFSLDVGVIYSPRITLNCVYGGDGGTRAKPEDGCGHDFCAASRSRRDGWCDGLPHHTSQVADVLTNLQPGNYNEVIINTKSIQDLLPTAVEAIFYLRGNKLGAQRAREVHTSFLSQYKLDADSHPLLRMDPNNLEHPLLADEEH